MYQNKSNEFEKKNTKRDFIEPEIFISADLVETTGYRFRILKTVSIEAACSMLLVFKLVHDIENAVSFINGCVRICL